LSSAQTLLGSRCGVAWGKPVDTSMLDELYADGTAVTAHRATPHFQNHASKIADLADRTALVLVPVQVA
jgi:quinol monooxygenase YgiN